jgi:hypothetical protein
MLREINNVRQIVGEPSRRWFTDARLDLVVWTDRGQTVGFQLCYDKQHGERAVTWKADSGFKHNAVDTGEDRPGRYKATPILVADGSFDPQGVAADFLEQSGDLDPGSRDFIYMKLLEYPSDA